MPHHLYMPSSLGVIYVNGRLATSRKSKSTPKRSLSFSVWVKSGWAGMGANLVDWGSRRLPPVPGVVVR